MVAARWATAVSTVMTRSRPAMMAAVLAISCTPCMRSGMAGRGAAPSCRANRAMPGRPVRLGRRCSGRERLASATKPVLPAQARPTRRISPGVGRWAGLA